MEGYKDASTATAAKTTSSIASIGAKTFVVSGASFDTLLASEISLTQNLDQLCYAVAMADSFFAGATTV